MHDGGEEVLGGRGGGALLGRERRAKKQIPPRSRGEDDRVNDRCALSSTLADLLVISLRSSSHTVRLRAASVQSRRFRVMFAVSGSSCAAAAPATGAARARGRAVSSSSPRAARSRRSDVSLSFRVRLSAFVAPRGRVAGRVSLRATALFGPPPDPDALLQEGKALYASGERMQGYKTFEKALRGRRLARAADEAGVAVQLHVLQRRVRGCRDGEAVPARHDDRGHALR